MRRTLLEWLISGYGPEPLGTESLVRSMSGVCQAEGWVSSENYYILKGRFFFFLLFREFQILALKRGKKVCLFFEILAFFLKRPPSPQALETSNSLTEKSELLWLKKLLS